MAESDNGCNSRCVFALSNTCNGRFSQTNKQYYEHIEINPGDIELIEIRADVKLPAPFQISSQAGIPRTVRF